MTSTHAPPEVCARRLLDLSVERHQARADGILLSRALWQSFAAVGSGLEFALGLDHCLRQHWLVDYGERLVLTKAGYAVARSSAVTANGRPRRTQGCLSPPASAAAGDENGVPTGRR